MYVYADNAATTAMSQVAINAMMPYLNKVYGNPSSLHSIGQEAKEALEAARETVAKCLGCEPRDIYFTSGGSEADNQAIISAARFGARKNKRHIISTAFEHHAVLHTLNKLEKEGFEVTLLDVSNGHNITAQQVKDAIRPDTCLVTTMYANNEIGSVLPIAEIGAVCKEVGVPFHTDAVQAAGHIHIDVKAQNIDMLSLSGHKFHGPKGVGALYCRRGLPLTNVIEGGAQERGKRAGTENIPGIMGLAAALEDACGHIDENMPRVAAMRDKLIAGLSQIPHSALNGDTVNRLPGNVSFCFEGIEGESLLLLLDMKGVCASSGSACTSGSLDPSHVLLAIGRVHDVAHGSLRLSLSAHKFHGPKGVGALYCRRGLALTNVIDGGAQERGKRAGTENLPGICGMVAALEESIANLEANTAKVTALRDKLIAGLSQIPHSALNGDAHNRLPGNVSFCFEGIEGEALLLLLDMKGVCASSGSACTSGSLDPSHVLLAIGRVHDVAHGSLRLSLSEYNTEEEVDHILKVVPEVVQYLRNMSPVWRDLQTGKREYIL